MATGIPEFSAILPVCRLTSSAVPASTAMTAPNLITRARSARAFVVSPGAAMVMGVYTSTPPPDKFGDCGGRMTYPVYSHVSGVTTATLAYENYCTTDPTTGTRQILNGQIPFVNTATPTASGPITTKLEASSAAAGVTMITRDSTGAQLTSQKVVFSSFAYNVGVPGGTPTSTNPDRMSLGEMTITDNVSGKSYRESNYSATMFETPSGSEQISFSGRGYRSNGEYFDIATTAPIVTSASGATVSGEITVSGANSSSVVLTMVPGAVTQATMKVNGVAYTAVPACR